MARRISSELFISRLSFYTTAEELKRLFSAFGAVTEARLIKDPRTQRPKGFAFVKFASEVNAQNAVKSMNGKIVNGRLIFVEFAESARSGETSHGRTFGSFTVFFTAVAPVSARSSKSTTGFYSTRLITIPTIYAQQKQFPWEMRVHVVSDSKKPTTFTVDSTEEGIDVLPDSGGSNDELGGPKGNGGGGGSNNGGNDNEGSEGSGESDDHNKGSDEKAKALSMSQKLTLGYATLVRVGGIIGYLKSGSQKSLIAGGGSALLLYCVYTMLPTNPVLASSLGFGMSASLLGVMGSRFKKSGKIFPAGIVSFASLVMSAGYRHGILRSVH